MADGNEMAIACNIGFIGAGNMAWAIGEGLVKSGAVSSKQIIVSAPTDSNLGRWRQLGSKTTFENGDVIKDSDVIILAMKPNKLDEALNDAIRTLPPNEVHSKVFVSLLAGVKVDGVHNKVNAVVPKSRVVRVMPNTPVAVGAGASIYCRGPTATTEDLNVVKKILSCGGICEEVPENLMDSAGALCGCGPAFIYIMIEALADGAVKMGVPRAMATKFAAQTVKGASMMVLETGKHPGLLKDEVCSPGGTTITGVHAMERSGVRISGFMNPENISRVLLNFIGEEIEDGYFHVKSSDMELEQLNVKSCVVDAETKCLDVGYCPCQWILCRRF